MKKNNTVSLANKFKEERKDILMATSMAYVIIETENELSKPEKFLVTEYWDDHEDVDVREIHYGIVRRFMMRTRVKEIIVCGAGFITIDIKCPTIRSFGIGSFGPPGMHALKKLIKRACCEKTIFGNKNIFPAIIIENAIPDDDVMRTLLYTR